MSVEERVLARIRPTPDEEARIEKLVREILDRLRSTLRSKGWEAKPFLAGSVAKGTHLTGTEIDVFVAFPPDLPRADLEERGLALGTILKNGTFRGVLEASLSWRPGIVLELDRAPARTFPEPLTVVDPVDPNRNVASAVSVEQLATFVHAAREYLESPSERFFFPRPLKPLSVSRLRAAVKRRGGGLLAISIPAPAVTDDVLYPQLRKAHRAFLDLFHRHEFHG